MPFADIEPATPQGSNQGRDLQLVRPLSGSRLLFVCSVGCHPRLFTVIPSGDGSGPTLEASAPSDLVTRCHCDWSFCLSTAGADACLSPCSSPSARSGAWLNHFTRAWFGASASVILAVSVAAISS